jgi:N6-adenosine-specific RNA methylase IME4
VTYRIILADPPWAYHSRSTWKKSNAGGGLRGDYPVMPTAEIAALPIGELADTDAALCLWATWPNLPDALAVMGAWGFKYRTVAFVWVKTTRRGHTFVGPGHYTRSNTEIVLLGVRGRMTPAARNVSQVVHAPHPRDADGRIIHSRKPAEVREHIVALFGDVPRVEVFAREAVAGWDALGNQAPVNPVTLRPRGA